MTDERFDAGFCPRCGATRMCDQIDINVRDADIEEYQQRIAELEQENERLRAECGLRQIHGYSEGMKRAAEIPVGYVVPVKDRGDKQAFTAGVMATREAIRAKLDKL
jgi:hypothetical protein